MSKSNTKWKVLQGRQIMLSKQKREKEEGEEGEAMQTFQPPNIDPFHLPLFLRPFLVFSRWGSGRLFFFLSIVSLLSTIL